MRAQQTRSAPAACSRFCGIPGMIKTAEGDRAKATEAGIQDWLDCGLRPLAGRCPARSSATIRYSAATFKSSVISKRAGREFPTHRSPFSILPVRIAGGTECRSTMDDAQSTPSEKSGFASFEFYRKPCTTPPGTLAYRGSRWNNPKTPAKFVSRSGFG